MQFSCLLNTGAEGLQRAQRETDRGRKVGKQPKHFRNQKAKERRDDVLKRFIGAKNTKEKLEGSHKGEKQTFKCNKTGRWVDMEGIKGQDITISGHI